MADDQFNIFPETLRGHVSPEMLGVRPEAKLEYPYAVNVGSIALGPLPAGCKIIGMKAGLFGKHGLVLIETDRGVFVSEVGKSRLTKLEPIEP